MQFGNELLELGLAAHGIERTVGSHGMNHPTEAAVECATQRQERRSPFAKQRMRAGTVVQRLAVPGIELENSPEDGVGFFLPAVTGISLRQPA